MAIMPDRNRAALAIQTAFRRHQARRRIVVHTRALFQQIAEQLGDDPNRIAWPLTYRPAYPVWRKDDCPAQEKETLNSDSCVSIVDSHCDETLEPSTIHESEENARGEVASDIGIHEGINSSPENELVTDSEQLSKLLRDLAWAQKSAIDRCKYLQSSNA